MALEVQVEVQQVERVGIVVRDDDAQPPAAQAATGAIGAPVSGSQNDTVAP
ncbi:MAG: hypothetical protein QOE99_2884 [Actinomycetota bacterium]|nr:hypothetical protein [Actinomycetota bacterium]